MTTQSALSSENSSVEWNHFNVSYELLSIKDDNQSVNGLNISLSNDFADNFIFNFEGKHGLNSENDSLILRYSAGIGAKYDFKYITLYTLINQEYQTVSDNDYYYYEDLNFFSVDFGFKSMVTYNLELGAKISYNLNIEEEYDSFFKDTIESEIELSIGSYIENSSYNSLSIGLSYSF